MGIRFFKNQNIKEIILFMDILKVKDYLTKNYKNIPFKKS